MTENLKQPLSAPQKTREERAAEALRENLLRRKAQAEARGALKDNVGDRKKCP